MTDSTRLYAAFEMPDNIFMPDDLMKIHMVSSFPYHVHIMTTAPEPYPLSYHKSYLLVK